jgi:hypothetical protein
MPRRCGSVAYPPSIRVPGIMRDAPTSDPTDTKDDQQVDATLGKIAGAVHRASTILCR